MYVKCIILIHKKIWLWIIISNKIIIKIIRINKENRKELETETEIIKINRKKKKNRKKDRKKDR